MSATASARAWNIGAAKYAAPFGVINTEPMLNDCGGPCYGPDYQTESILTGSARARSRSSTSTAPGGTGPATLEQWILGGLSGLMNVGWYWGDTGASSLRRT